MIENTSPELKAAIVGSKLHSILTGAGYTTHHQDGPIDWMRAPRPPKEKDDERREEPMVMSAAASR